MPRQVNIDDVLKLIEFELAQQSLPQDDIAEAIQRLHKFQTHWYSEILNKGKAPKTEEVVHALFNANQTMLMLIQTISSKFEAIQLELARLKQFIASRIINDKEKNIDSIFSDISYIKDSLNSMNYHLTNISPLYDLNIQIRHSSIPVIGTLLNRLRAAFHQLVYFYMSRYIKHQNNINETYKKLMQELIYLNLEYIARLEALTKEIQKVSERSDS